MATSEEVVIVGGGIAGLATAVGLKRVGIPALVLEAAHGLRTTGGALTLYSNAWSALRALGVSHKLTPFYLPLRGANVMNVATGVVTISNGLISRNTKEEARAPREVHRKALLEALAEELPPDSIRFSSKISTIQIDDQGLAHLHLSDGTTVRSKVVIGCDGVHSVVAKWLGLSDPIESGKSAIRGLSYFPQGHDLDQQALRFLDVGKAAGLIPLNNYEVYWFYVSRQGVETKEPEEIQQQLLENYAKDFPMKFKEAVQNTDLSTVNWAPLMLRQPWKVLFRKLSKGNVTVCGDAMHPMTPDLGQGGCSSLEDAVVLSRHIGNHVIKNKGRIVAEEMAEVIIGYVKERRWRAVVLISGSFLTGWIQDGRSSWWMKLLRAIVFRLFLARRFFNATLYDCGSLPCVSISNKLD